MSAALREPLSAPAPMDRIGMNGPGSYPRLQLEDFGSHGSLGGAVAGAEAAFLARIRAEAHAEGKAAAHDQQLTALIEALSAHANALDRAVQDRQSADSQLREAIGALLHAVAARLLPIGRDEQLIAALVKEAATRPTESGASLVIGCPDTLHDALRKASSIAGLPEPMLESAAECFIRAGAEITRIDLTAMQDRLMRLIDDYAAGDP